MANPQKLINGRLSDAQVASYWENGYLFPMPAVSAEKAAGWRRELEALEAKYADGGLPLPVAQYLRVNTYCVVPLAMRIAADPGVLDVVEGILGPDLMAWSVEFFIEEAKSDKIVSWHQDRTYWGLGETNDQLTAWIALSPATLESGCMKFVPGTHKNPIVPHNDTFAADNLLSRGQEVAVEVKEEDAVAIEIQPGQMSLHHGLIFHGSGPNLSDDRRIACVARYVNPNARQHVAERDFAVLARGADRAGAFTHFVPPHEPFTPASLALYDEIVAAQAKALTAGAKQDVGMYAGKRK